MCTSPTFAPFFSIYIGPDANCHSLQHAQSGYGKSSYLNAQLPSSTMTSSQSLKKITRKLKPKLINGGFPQQQMVASTLPKSAQNKQKSNALKQKFSHTKMVGGKYSLSIRKITSEDQEIRNKKDKYSDKQSSICIPILNQQDEEGESRSPSYIERLLTSQSRKILVQRILRRKKKQKSNQQEWSKQYSKCALNKRMLNKLCKKTTPTLKQVEKDDSPSTKEKQSQIAKFFNQKRVWREKKLILSPIKHKQRQIEQISKPIVDLSAIMKSSSYQKSQFGPWKYQNQSLLDL